MNIKKKFVKGNLKINEEDEETKGILFLTLVNKRYRISKPT